MNLSEIGAVVVTYNSGHVLRSCLGALLSSHHQVVVVDNNSADNTRKIAAEYPVHLVENPINRGFAAAVNQGFQLLETPWILLLNPDLTLIRPLSDLGDVLVRENTGAVTALLAGEDGALQTQFQFRRFPSPWTLLFENLGINRALPWNPVNRHYRYAGASWDRLQPVEQPAGAFLLVRREAWRLIGGFDESFFPLWFEDVDFCLRIHRAGFRILFLPQVIGLHSGGHSIHPLEPSLRQLYWYRSLLHYAAKHFSPLWVRMLGVTVLFRSAAKAVSMVFQSGRLGDIVRNRPAAVLGLQTILHGRPPSSGPQQA